MEQRHTTPTPPPDELLRRLGQLTGQVMARIKLQQARVALAVELQRHMLPPELPGLPGLRTAARYVPAQTGLDIGGDWYDAFVLPDGSLGFAIGDVQGHDVEAAAFMGMVRTGLRAIAGATTDPGDVLSRANDLLVSMSSDLLTTCTIALGAFLVNVSLGPSPAVVLAIVAGNTLGPLLAYRLLRRAGFRVELDRLRDAVALVFLGALTGMLVSATIGSGALVLSGALPAAEFWPTWAVWWTGDAMGVLVITPVLLLLSAARWPTREQIRPLRWLEAALLAAFTCTVTLLAVSSSVNLLYLVSPCLIWAAFRFQRAGAAPCALLVSTIAIVAAAESWGPFARHELLTNMATLQAFNGITALTALLLAAVVTERRNTHEEIRRVCAQLAEAISRLDPGAVVEQWPPPRKQNPDDDG